PLPGRGGPGSSAAGAPSPAGPSGRRRSDDTASEAPTGGGHRGEGPGPRVVVLQIEDNPSNAALVERVLAKRRSVRLVSAAEARTGLELARQHRPDLVLLDLHLPDLPGGEL